ncbi:hypothetical protein J6590_035762 [Homalodisca vitripennis]|nr:hypothetical protein J6590_035762 [Homalodisca vitripennis]
MVHLMVPPVYPVKPRISAEDLVALSAVKGAPSGCHSAVDVYDPCTGGTCTTVPSNNATGQRSTIPPVVPFVYDSL